MCMTLTYIIYRPTQCRPLYLLCDVTEVGKYFGASIPRARNVASVLNRTMPEERSMEAILLLMTIFTHEGVSNRIIGSHVQYNA